MSLRTLTTLTLLALAVAGCRSGEEPAAVFVCTGMMRGYVEPCGCTRPQLGGLARRDRLIGSIQPAPILLDNGDLTLRVGRQAHIKWQTAISALATMGYRAVNVGEKDLALGPEFIKREAASAGVPLISANIADAHGTLLFQPFVILEAKPYRVAVIGLLQPDLAGALPVQIIDPARALADAMKQLEGRCDRVVLLAHGTSEFAAPLTKQLPNALFTVCAHQGDDPNIEHTPRGLLFSTGKKGKHVVRCDVFAREGNAAVKAREIELGPKLKDTSRMTALLAFYQEVLKAEDLLGKVPREAHPGGLFAGSASCRECHEDAMAVWKASGHAHALKTLEKGNRNFDPECVVCHVVGLKHTGGYRSIAGTPQLAGVGCEQCHGPGKAHGAAPLKIKMPKAGPKTCERCHDPDHDPKFDFKTYWPKIKHD